MFKSVLYAFVSLVVGMLAFIGTVTVIEAGVHPLVVLLGVCSIFLALIWEFRAKPGEHPWDTE